MENFPSTYFVGGTVRDLVMGDSPLDVDMATSAKPAEIKKILESGGFAVDSRGERFGVTIAKKQGSKIEIATLRKDTYSNSRYPKVSFVKNPKTDSKRRDFTINSLYLSIKSHELFDYCGGLRDIKRKIIRFSGHPGKRIKEDPLRAVRAIRFALDLDFKIEPETLKSIKKYWPLVKILAKQKVENEVKKIKIKNAQRKFREIFDNKNFLDKYVASS